MGCDILVGRSSHGLGLEYACFYDSVTETVFGVLLDSLEEAESFQKSVDVDLRKLSHDEFVKLLNDFREERKEDEERIK